MSSCWEHIKKESNKRGPGDQGEGEEIAKRAPATGPTHNGGAATIVVWREGWKGGGQGGVYFSRRPGFDIICDYYSLCGVSLAPVRGAERSYVLTHRASFIRARIALNCKSCVCFAARDERSRGARRTVHGNGARREEWSKTGEIFAYMHSESALSQVSVSRIGRSSQPGVSLWLRH